MDATEDLESDIKVQRASAELLADFSSFLRPFLWRTLANGEQKIRRRVRARETDRLVALLSPHQEDPQLLDPYLAKFLPPLCDAFIEYLTVVKPSKKPSTALLIPVSDAICKLLYTFCKIRGEKVVVRFFNAEAKNLELLLSAVEIADARSSSDCFDEAVVAEDTQSTAWSWEERYISLLWLSHLLLAPFDLASISSEGTTNLVPPEIPRLAWPPNLPGVALRVIPLAIKYLACAGKERDAAKSLLVRISMRKDMQALGLLQSLIHWALSSLQQSTIQPDNSPYYYIGILSYLGGILVSSSSTSDLDPYLETIFQTVQTISDPSYVAFKTIHTSAQARKAVIKVLRSIVVLVLRPSRSFKQESTSESHIPGLLAASDSIVEDTISSLIEALADSDTPIRLAASKALSVITLKLDPDMAVQVVDAVLEGLDNNVLWVERTFANEHRKVRDLSAVNPMEWHGLMLTLSHLLYRRSPPANSLPAILQSLLIGLSFEQRSSSGSSIGTNVRDAACFGIWALARRYSTQELLSVPSSSVTAAQLHGSSVSIIQVLASELVVSACLDSAGNIRRGASAALQELIGRHENTVESGIRVVQVVDYHAVALRQRAALEVAREAAGLSEQYQSALMNALLDWRGAGDADAAWRRTAGKCVGFLTSGGPIDDQPPILTSQFRSVMEHIYEQLSGLKAREVDKRHGLILAISGVISSFVSSFNMLVSQIGIANVVDSTITETGHIFLTSQQILIYVFKILKDAQETSYRKPELIAEAASILTSAVCPVLLLSFAPNLILLPGAKDKSDVCNHFMRLINHPVFHDMHFVENVLAEYEFLRDSPTGELAVELNATLLKRTEKDVVEATVDAASRLLTIMNESSRESTVKVWMGMISDNNGGRAGTLAGFLPALTDSFSWVAEQLQTEICQVIQSRWDKASDIETRVTILQCLTRSSILTTYSAIFVSMIAQGLDDYTTDGRGDVGSLVRVEALKAHGKIFATRRARILLEPSKGKDGIPDSGSFDAMLGRILRLALEKLDKVRAEAQRCLSQLCLHDGSSFQDLSVTSSKYFESLLDLQTMNWLDIPRSEFHPEAWRLDIFEGIVSSADTGSEEVIRVSRAALARFCERNRDGEESDGPVLTTQNASGFVFRALFDVAKRNEFNDRILIPALETIAFLFDAGIMQRAESGLDWKSLYMLVQKAHYKSTNTRKLEACVKVYGGLLSVYPVALDKLAKMLLHPYPQVRNQVIDVIFVAKGVGKGVDWAIAKKVEVDKLKAEIGLHDLKTRT